MQTIYANGNAFYVMQIAKLLMKDLEYSSQDANAVLDEMKAGDYEHLIKVFDKYFGNYVEVV